MVPPQARAAAMASSSSSAFQVAIAAATAAGVLSQRSTDSTRAHSSGRFRWGRNQRPSRVFHGWVTVSMWAMAVGMGMCW